MLHVGRLQLKSWLALCWVLPAKLLSKREIPPTVQPSSPASTIATKALSASQVCLRPRRMALLGNQAGLGLRMFTVRCPRAGESH